METKKRIFLSSPHMSEEGYEQSFVQEAFDTNWIAPLGANVDGFEKELSDKVGVKAAAALTSGTAAMQMALKSIGVEAGDVVFCQSLTFSASANPAIYEGAELVFIDSDAESWNMSPEALKEGLEKYAKAGRIPKAVIVVHLYGMAAKLDEIKTLCKEYGTILIEDAAESLGSLYHERYTGTFGDYGVFSFNGNKIITSSGGGMLVCNLNDAEKKIQKVRFWATQSKEPGVRHYEHKEIGYNFRMSNIVAGIGRGQLKVLDRRVEKKRYIYGYYRSQLESLDGVSFMPELSKTHCNCWLTVILLDDKCSVKPIDIIEALEAENIESRPVWKPMHLQPIFSDCDYIDCGGVAEKLFENGVCLPSDTKMTEEDLKRVCRIISALWR